MKLEMTWNKFIKGILCGNIGQHQRIRFLDTKGATLMPPGKEYKWANLARMVD